jgi:hypothetical protein
MNINESKEITVFANKFWNDGQLTVERGQKFHFKAIGTWIDLYIPSTADGSNKPFMARFNQKKRSPSDNWLALMGSVDKGTQFLIGSEKIIEFNESGHLFFFANDIKGFYWNNFGKIILKISRIA